MDRRASASTRHDIVTLRASATPTAPALVLRPWRSSDVAALIAAHRDPTLRRWTGSALHDEADATRWVQAQQRGWAAGTRFGFAVVDSAPARLVGNVVLKGIQPGKPSAEVGYWTAAHARGRGVATRALEARSPAGPSTPSGPADWSGWTSCTRSTTWPRAGSP